MTVTMTSEVENITKGRLQKTMDYEGEKKIIGIAQSTIVSPDGISPAPLSKQSAFVVMQEENIQQAAAKVLGTDIPDVAGVSITAPGELQAPSVSDITLDSSVKMENSENLGTMAAPGIISADGTKVENGPTSFDQIADAVTSGIESVLATEPVPEIPTDITLPENKEEVVGLEPAAPADALFAGAPAEDVISEENKVVLENPAVQGLDGGAQTIDVTDSSLTSDDTPGTTQDAPLPEVAPAPLPADEPMPIDTPLPDVETSAIPDETPGQIPDELPPLDMPVEEHGKIEDSQQETSSVPSDIEKYNKLVADEMSQAIVGVMNKHINEMIAMRQAEQQAMNSAAVGILPQEISQEATMRM